MKDKRITQKYINEPLDPLFRDIFHSFYEQGNISLIDLQDKIEKYVDSRIGLYLKERTKSN